MISVFLQLPAHGWLQTGHLDHSRHNTQQGRDPRGGASQRVTQGPPASASPGCLLTTGSQAPPGPSEREALGQESRGQHSPAEFTSFLRLRTTLSRGSSSLLSLAGQAPGHRRDVGTETSGLMPCHHLQSCSPRSHGIWASVPDSPASSCFLPLLLRLGSSPSGPC